MCTSVSIKTKKEEVMFGRTLDFSYDIDPEIYIVPVGYEWNNQIDNCFFINKYKFIATGQNIGHVVFTDGANEKGLGVAALYFEGFAYYNQKGNNKITVANLDLVNYILGNCANVLDVIKKMKQIDIIGVEDNITHSVAPLHWIVVDKNNNAITIEKTFNGLQIYDNPLKILTNSPDFNWHMTNLRNYINLTPDQVNYKKWNNEIFKSFSQGGGSFGLPGDFTSPSRFVQMAFQKSFIDVPNYQNDVINMCFNMMKKVFVAKGLVLTSRNTYDYTRYIVFINLNTGDYYFNTYYNNQITKLNINDYVGNEIVSLGKLQIKNVLQ
ncbi:MAG: choloylglycine hydrolase family protein [Bacilli bacterium]|nr:choloylglycine hydrolase family protein [Bacilli bacterium]